MKKKFLGAVALTLAIFSFTSCGSGTVGSTYAGAFWYKESNVDLLPINEKLTYGVTVEGKDGDWGGSKSESVLTFTPDDKTSSYVTELTVSDDRKNYVYTTKLTISGEYVSGDKKSTVENDTIETVTTFTGFNDGFTPIKSVRTVKSTTPGIDGDKIEYVATTVYEGTTATSSVEILSEKADAAFKKRAENAIKVKKYNKKSYIDNDLMILMFRNFKYDASTSYSFRTIDVVSGELKNATGAIKTRGEQNSKTSAQTATPTFPYTVKNWSLDGGRTFKDVSFSASEIVFQTTGEFAQTIAKVYYGNTAGDNRDCRHAPIVIMQPFASIGILKLTLESATFGQN